MPAGHTELESIDPQADRPRAPRAGIFQDPVVRRMAYVATALVAVFLVTVVSALLTGVIASAGPRTLAEKQVAVAGAAVQAGSKDPADWNAYIAALIANGQYALARDEIAAGRASINDSATADFSLSEARLLSAQKDYKGAIAAADKALAQMGSYNKAQLAAGGTTARTAKAVGLPDNYYAAILVKAYAYRDQNSFRDAVAQFDIYIQHDPGASDILVDRGKAKADAGDKAGAEADFRTALKYVPNDPEAVSGLKKIGASR